MSDVLVAVIAVAVILGVVFLLKKFNKSRPVKDGYASKTNGPTDQE